MELLSAQWLAERLRLGSELPGFAGANALLQHEVTGGPNGTVYFYDDIKDGRLVDSAPGQLPEPEVTIRYDWSVELALTRGTLDPVSGVLTGQIIVDGDMGRLLPLVSVLETDAAVVARLSLYGVTATPAP
jgi:hypothetical protein